MLKVTFSALGSGKFWKSARNSDSLEQTNDCNRNLDAEEAGRGWFSIFILIEGPGGGGQSLLYLQLSFTLCLLISLFPLYFPYCSSVSWPFPLHFLPLLSPYLQYLNFLPTWELQWKEFQHLSYFCMIFPFSSSHLFFLPLLILPLFFSLFPSFPYRTFGQRLVLLCTMFTKMMLGLQLAVADMARIGTWTPHV